MSVSVVTLVESCEKVPPSMEGRKTDTKSSGVGSNSHWRKSDQVVQEKGNAG